MPTEITSESKDSTTKKSVYRPRKLEIAAVYMPDGIKETPCIRIGDVLIYKRNQEQIHAAMIEVDRLKNTTKNPIRSLLFIFLFFKL